jgi:hypothetical protein
VAASQLETTVMDFFYLLLLVLLIGTTSAFLRLCARLDLHQ